MFQLTNLPPVGEIETKLVLKKTISANRQLALLKGISGTIPNESILINNLFYHPYTKIEFMEQSLKVSRLTATKYLEQLVAGGFLQKEKIGRYNYYINKALFKILTEDSANY